MYVEYLCCSGFRDFDQKARGTHLPSTHWSRLAPRQFLDASVDKARGAEGIGYSNLMALTRRVFASWNAF